MRCKGSSPLHGRGKQVYKSATCMSEVERAEIAHRIAHARGESSGGKEGGGKKGNGTSSLHSALHARRSRAGGANDSARLRRTCASRAGGGDGIFTRWRCRGSLPSASLVRESGTRRCGRRQGPPIAKISLASMRVPTILRRSRVAFSRVSPSLLDTQHGGLALASKRKSPGMS
jgi:hypothetical protein